MQSLWIGKPLSKLEQLCFKSFLDNGHTVHLYVYDNISNVPSGVIIKDANEILDKSKQILLFISKSNNEKRLYNIKKIKNLKKLISSYFLQIRKTSFTPIKNNGAIKKGIIKFTIWKDLNKNENGFVSTVIQ